MLLARTEKTVRTVETCLLGARFALSIIRFITYCVNQYWCRERNEIENFSSNITTETFAHFLVTKV